MRLSALFSFIVDSKYLCYRQLTLADNYSSWNKGIFTKTTDFVSTMLLSERNRYAFNNIF